MFQVSDTALKILHEYIKEQHMNSVIRITPMAGSCSGPRLRLRLGEHRPNDALFIYSSIHFVIDKDLLASCEKIHVDFIELENSCCCSGGCGGFRIQGSKAFPFAGRCTENNERCDRRCLGFVVQEPEETLPLTQAM
jgi:Fe-S cluster assembly iron-binding protein IscA